MKRRWKGRFIKDGKRARLQNLSEKASSQGKRCEDSENYCESTENDSNVSAKSGWGIGRRIVELGHIAEQMRACNNCSIPLHLHNINSEQRVGYASILYIACDCGSLNSVSTGKSHRPPNKEKKGMPVYDINTKAVLGVMNAGLTYRQMNGLMATMEVKGLHHTAMMRRRQEIDPHIQTVANDSCLTALGQEAEPSQSMLSPDKPQSLDCPTTTSPMQEGIFKYDMGWQKRGSGRAYDSKSGVGTLIGNSTGKICAFGVRISDCRLCKNAQNKEDIPPHQCCKNWTGSAKAMEPDVGIDLIQSVEKAGVMVNTIIMDDDTTTMARIRKELSHTVTKWSDVNHTSKHLSNSLFSLQKKHKCLNNKTIAYLKKCFNYALAQTKSDPTQCRIQIEQIVPHVFGEHENCGDWCSYRLNPEEYRHKLLTTDLEGEELRTDLTAVFQVFSQNAEKIAPGGSTRDVESFNNMVASKAPKRCHFSASSNLKSRVGCAVAQKNLGYTYINSINESIGLSPGRVYSEEAIRRDTERKRQKTYVNKRENKLRKLQQKLKRKLDKCSKEKKEGITYKTAVATLSDNENCAIPLHTHQPKIQQVTSSDKLVFCDIETGSLYRDCDILQIAACYNGKSFNQYIRPTKPISTAASNVTGLMSQGGVLFLNGSPVESIPLKDAMKAFIAWISEIGPVVLVGHNFRVFDFPRLIRAVKLVDFEAEFDRVCLGGIDTLPLFKEKYPNSEKYKQEFLYENLLREKYDAHNALDDVLSLERLLKFSSPSTETLQRHSFTTSWGFELHQYNENMVSNCETLQILLKENVISKQTANKIAGSGLQLVHLHSVYKQHGAEGLHELLGEKFSGVPRVTSSKKISENISRFFENCK